MNSLQVQDLWYRQIVSGRKDVEGRTGGPEKFAGWTGNNIRISNGKGQSVVLTVSAVRHYPNLHSYLEGEGWERVAPHTGSTSGAARAYKAITIQDSVQVFSNKRVLDRGGICAIELVPSAE